MVMKLALLTAVHAHPVCVVTEMLELPPVNGKLLLIGFIVKTQIGTQAENSEVLPAGSVAVAVNWPPVVATLRVRLNVALPLPLVVTSAAPRKFSASPLPDGSHARFE